MVLAGILGPFHVLRTLSTLGPTHGRGVFSDLPVGCVNFLYQDHGDSHQVADSVAAALRPCFPRSDVNRANLLQKLTIDNRSFPRHTPSSGSSLGQCSSGPVGDLIFTSSVLLRLVAVLRTGRNSSSQVGGCPLVSSLLAPCHVHALH